MTAFATIKVRQGLRRWLKTEAASRDVHMYELLENLVATASGFAEDERPWREVTDAPAAATAEPAPP